MAIRPHVCDLGNISKQKEIEKIMQFPFIKSLPFWYGSCFFFEKKILLCIIYQKNFLKNTFFEWNFIQIFLILVFFRFN